MTPLDKMFGTFRDKMKEDGTSYIGGSEEKTDAKSVAIHDTKANLYSMPGVGYVVYISINLLIWGFLWMAVMDNNEVQPWSPHVYAFLTSFGPLIIAQAMTNLTDISKRSVLYPFHKEGWKTMSSHLIISSILTIGPVYIMIHMLLSNPGESFYFMIRN